MTPCSAGGCTAGGMSTRDGCLPERLADGSWHSAYDNVTDASKLDIDDLVPLAEAWESGGQRGRRRRGDASATLDDPRSLIAVTASTNRSKGAGDPADWLPPRTQYRCRYTADWVAVKARWELSVDRREQAGVGIRQLHRRRLRRRPRRRCFLRRPRRHLADSQPHRSTCYAQSNADTDPSADPAASEPNSAASCTHWHTDNPKHTHTRRADGTVTGHPHPPSSQTKCGHLWQ